MKRKMMVFGCITTMMLLFFEQDCFAKNVLTQDELRLAVSQAAATKRLTGKIVVLGVDKPWDEMVVNLGDRFGHVQKIKKMRGGDMVLTDYFKTVPIPEIKFNNMFERQEDLINNLPSGLDFDRIRFDDNQNAYVVTIHDIAGKLRVLQTIK